MAPTKPPRRGQSKATRVSRRTPWCVWGPIPYEVRSAPSRAVTGRRRGLGLGLAAAFLTAQLHAENVLRRRRKRGLRGRPHGPRLERKPGGQPSVQPTHVAAEGLGDNASTPVGIVVLVGLCGPVMLLQLEQALPDQASPAIAERRFHRQLLACKQQAAAAGPEAVTHPEQRLSRSSQFRPIAAKRTSAARSSSLSTVLPVLDEIRAAPGAGYPAKHLLRRPPPPRTVAAP